MIHSNVLLSLTCHVPYIFVVEYHRIKLKCIDRTLNVYFKGVVNFYRSIICRYFVGLKLNNDYILTSKTNYL